MRNTEGFGRLIGILSNEIGRSCNADFEEQVLTGKQRRILHYIIIKSEQGQVFQKDIEKEFNMRRSSASTMLTNMEEAGVIKREGVSYDGRLKLLKVTEKGEEIKAEVLKDCKKLEEKIIRDIPKEQLNVCAEVLRKMIDNLRED